MRAALVAVAFVGGCGGGHGGSVAITDFASDYKRSLCEWGAACGVFPDVATCEAANIGFRLHVDQNLIAAIDAGKVVYSAANASACLAAYASRSCDATSEDNRVTPAACNEIVAGTVAANGTCAQNAECVSQSCSAGSCGASMCCTGTCVGDTPPPTTVAIGGTCADSSQCAAGGFCDNTQKCAPLLASGAACTSADSCAYGTSCITTGGTTQTCEALPGPKQPCPNNACADVGNYCDATATCVGFAQLGQACSQTERCAPSFVCGTSGTCTSGPTVANGQTCTGSCADDGSFCDAQTMKCTPWLADGQACSNDTDCVSDHCLASGTATTCGEPPQCI